MQLWILDLDAWPKNLLEKIQDSGIFPLKVYIEHDMMLTISIFLVLITSANQSVISVTS